MAKIEFLFLKNLSGTVCALFKRTLQSKVGLWQDGALTDFLIDTFLTHGSLGHALGWPSVNVHAAAVRVVRSRRFLYCGSLHVMAFPLAPWRFVQFREGDGLVLEVARHRPSDRASTYHEGRAQLRSRCCWRCASSYFALSLLCILPFCPTHRLYWVLGAAWWSPSAWPPCHVDYSSNCYRQSVPRGGGVLFFSQS